MVACCRGAAVLIKRMNDADIAKRDNFGRTLLYQAAAGAMHTGDLAQLEILKLLLSRMKESDINAVDIHNDTALHYAVRVSTSQFVALLAAHSDVYMVNARGFTAMQEASRAMKLGMVKALLPFMTNDEGDSNVDTGGHVAKFNDIDVLRDLLSNIPYHDVYSVKRSCYINDSFADVLEIFELLLARLNAHQVATRDANGASILHDVAFRGWSEFVSLLLVKLDDEHVSARDNQGKTPLHYGASQCWLRTIVLLLPRSDLTAQDNNGMTALHVAISPTRSLYVSNEHTGPCDGIGSRLTILNAMGSVALSIEDISGKTVFHSACSVRCSDFFWAILNRMDANDVMKLDRFGFTPIYYAAKFSPDALKYFRQKVKELGVSLSTQYYHDEKRGTLERVQEDRVRQYRRNCEREQEREQERDRERRKSQQYGETSLRGYSAWHHGGCGGG